MPAYRSPEAQKYHTYYNNICDLLRFEPYQNQAMRDLKDEIEGELIELAILDTQVENDLLLTFNKLTSTESNIK